MARFTPFEAADVLALCHARGDFHALGTNAVEALIAQADKYGYRKPKNASVRLKRGRRIVWAHGKD